MSTRVDVVVVGAGPGGIAAAVVAAEAGKRVCLVDESTALGGQIWRGFRVETARASIWRTASLAEQATQLYFAAKFSRASSTQR